MMCKTTKYTEKKRGGVAQLPKETSAVITTGSKKKTYKGVQKRGHSKKRRSKNLLPTYKKTAPK